MDPSSPLSRLCVVLSRTSHPGNIGAAARAMKTMGFTDLRLVSPRFFPDSAQDVMYAMLDPETTGYYRMVVTYWDMAASFVNHGAIFAALHAFGLAHKVLQAIGALGGVT